MRALAICFLASLTAASGARLPEATPLDAAVNRIYNFDFRGAGLLIERHTAAHREDPLGYAIRASSLLFSELSRLDALGKGYMTSDARISGKDARKPDSRVREQLFAALAEGERLSEQALQRDPDNTNALLAMTILKGAERDYTALIEKRLRASLTHAQASQAYASRLLKVDPGQRDAYFTSGFSEYLLGSVPFVVRWLIRFDDVQGSKREGLKKLEVAAQSGRYLRPFAQMMLAMFYLREKQPEQSERLLRELSLSYPDNPVFRRELDNLQSR